ncbi:kelch-like protein diablo [Montipora foliosa]|uniref:kelch-like protein diablo n=1 Tax=Montipora foliosa TaxID=591990 RepID=UPI0035F13F9D
MEAVNEPMSSGPSKHLQEFAQRLDILRRNEGFGDITISVKGKQFTAHKAVLAASSPFFFTLLNSDMKESSEKLITVELEEATEAVMEDVLKYVYTGNLLVTEERAHNLIATTNYLLLPGLKTMAEGFLKSIVTTENCIFNYYFAEKYQCLELKKKARQVIISKFTDVVESEDFLKLEVKQVLEWVSSDDIIVNAEDDVFKAIVRCYESDTEFQ